jgi:hypothetical protein
MSWWKSLTGFAIAGSTIIVLPIILRWIDGKETDAVAASHHPDVTLRFVYPQNPALQLMNISDKTAREIKYAVIVWNIDLPDRLDPLPIPVSTFDFLNAGQISGPEGVFFSPLVTPLVKPGNRLFGSASVSCPECSRGRTFVVSIVWGESGWFAELPNDTSGELVLPATPFTPNTIIRYFTELSKTIPETSRIPIEQP